MKQILLTLTVFTIFLKVNAQRSLEFEIFTDKFFYENQTINVNKRINSNNIRQFYLNEDGTWLFLPSNGNIQKSIGNGFVDNDISHYSENSSYSKQPVSFYFPIS